MSGNKNTTEEASVLHRGVTVSNVLYLGAKVMHNDVSVGLLHEIYEKSLRKPYIFSYPKPHGMDVSLRIDGEQISVYEYNKRNTVVDNNLGDNHYTKCNLIQSHPTSYVSAVACAGSKNLFGLVIYDNGRLMLHVYVTRCRTQVHDLSTICRLAFRRTGIPQAHVDAI